jgi:hypothetical protein
VVLDDPRILGELMAHSTRSSGQDTPSYPKDWKGPQGAVNQEAETANREPASSMVSLLDPLASHCVHASKNCGGCRNVSKVQCHKHGVVQPIDYCGRCADRLPLAQLHIGAVITAWNEGAEVLATIRSLMASVLEARLTVIVVDDGSTDGSCDHIIRDTGPGRLVRNVIPVGVGKSRNVGWRVAAGMGCHAVSFHDAHMRFGAEDYATPRAIETLAVRAVQRGGLLASASRAMPPKGILAGCRLQYGPNFSIQAKWDSVKLEGWQPTPCIMGAGYVLSACTARAMEAPTGQLWEDTAGRWGFSEEALSLKAHLLGIPVLTNRGVVIAHKYRSANPIPDSSRECWKNIARATVVLFGQKLYQRRFEPICAKAVARSTLGKIVAEAAAVHEVAMKAAGPAGWPVPVEKVLTEVIQPAPPEPPKPAPASGDAHAVVSPKTGGSAARPDWDFEPMLRKWLRELSRVKGGEPTTQAPRALRVLEWGPGHSTEVIHDELGGFSTILSIEHQKSFADRAAAAHPYAQTIHAPVRDYGASDYSVYPGLTGEALFDVIFVDGRRRAECLLMALDYLAPGGIVLLHDAQRPHYQPAVRRLYDVVERDAKGHTLVLRPKRGAEDA